VNHETISKLHGLGTSGTDFTRDNNFTTLGARFHDETNDTITGTTNSQTVKELELDRLTLSNGTETTVLDTFGIKFNSVLGKLETLLDKSGQFANTTTLLTKNVLSVGGTDDNSIDSHFSPNFYINIYIYKKKKKKTQKLTRYEQE
jgi:hypothetical protein